MDRLSDVTWRGSDFGWISDIINSKCNFKIKKKYEPYILVIARVNGYMETVDKFFQERKL